MRSYSGREGRDDEIYPVVAACSVWIVVGAVVLRR
jgi:hypothetical protein